MNELMVVVVAIVTLACTSNRFGQSNLATKASSLQVSYSCVSWSSSIGHDESMADESKCVSSHAQALAGAASVDLIWRTREYFFLRKARIDRTMLTTITPKVLNIRPMAAPRCRSVASIATTRRVGGAEGGGCGAGWLGGGEMGGGFEGLGGM